MAEANERGCRKVWLPNMTSNLLHQGDGRPFDNRPVSLLAPLFDQLPVPLVDDRQQNPRYKTEICRNFKERSKCIYGDKCQFAHGRRELRDVVRNSKYKTKLCQKYWLVGYCAYGPRCNFLHDESGGEEIEEFFDSPVKNDQPGSSMMRSITPTNLFDVHFANFGLMPPPQDFGMRDHQSSELSSNDRNSND